MIARGLIFIARRLAFPMSESEEINFIPKYLILYKNKIGLLCLMKYLLINRCEKMNYNYLSRCTR